MKTDAIRKLSKQAKAQVSMLSAQLLLGMAVNLIGLPKEVGGDSKVVTTIFLILHIGIGVGLLVGSLLVVRIARSVGPHFVRDAWIGVAVIVGTITAGILTMLLDNNWWSYVMAVGFLTSLLLYGAMFVYAERQKNTRA